MPAENLQNPDEQSHEFGAASSLHAAIADWIIALHVNFLRPPHFRSPAMKRLRPVALLALLALAGPAAAQETPALLVPTKEHKEMARDVGVWDAETSLRVTPDAAPVNSKGVETVKMMGEFWLVSTFEGEMMGQPFHGQSQTTYDPLKKKFVGTWIDTMAPTLNTLEGDYDAETHTLTMMMNGVDPMTSKPMKWKTITRYESDDAKTFEMHLPVEGQEGQWWKSFEIKYKRRK
jgi:hypothetical protein